jgi:hypothetical protein
MIEQSLVMQLEWFLAKGRDLKRGTWANYEAPSASEAERFASALAAYAPHAEDASSVTTVIEANEERGVYHVWYRVGRKRGPATGR